MTRFGTIPPEPPEIHDPSGLCPAFRARVENQVFPILVSKGWSPVWRETLRSNERETWLYGFGRDYDDGRGIVTNATSGQQSWHYEKYCLAGDVIDSRYADAVRQQFWDDLYEATMAAGLTSGQDWHRTGTQKDGDKPHVQWFTEGMHVSPSPHALELVEEGGSQALWEALNAV